MLGKLKKTLSHRCPDCNTKLQLREIEADGIENGFNVSLFEEYIYCPECGYERDVEQKKKKRRGKENFTFEEEA